MQSMTYPRTMLTRKSLRG